MILGPYAATCHLNIVSLYIPQVWAGEHCPRRSQRLRLDREFEI